MFGLFGSNDNKSQEQKNRNDMSPKERREYDRKKKQEESDHIYVVLEFYLRFVNRIRQMLDRNTETDILSIMEPR